METALGSASWLLGLVLNKLSDDLVKAYVSSTELGLKFVQIRKEMLYTKASRDETSNPPASRRQSRVARSSGRDKQRPSAADGYLPRTEA